MQNNLKILPVFQTTGSFDLEMEELNQAMFEPIPISNPTIDLASHSTGVSAPKPINQALNTTIGQVANAVGNAGGTILGNLLTNVVEGLGNGIANTQAVTNAGATVVDGVIKAWFKKNWKWVVVGVVTFFGVIYVIVKKPFSKKKPYTRKK